MAPKGAKSAAADTAEESVGDAMQQQFAALLPQLKELIGQHVAEALGRGSPPEAPATAAPADATADLANDPVLLTGPEDIPHQKNVNPHERPNTAGAAPQLYSLHKDASWGVVSSKLQGTSLQHEYRHLTCSMSYLLDANYALYDLVQAAPHLAKEQLASSLSVVYAQLTGVYDLQSERHSYIVAKAHLKGSEREDHLLALEAQLTGTAESLPLSSSRVADLLKDIQKQSISHLAKSAAKSSAASTASARAAKRPAAPSTPTNLPPAPKHGQAKGYGHKMTPHAAAYQPAASAPAEE